MKPLFRGGIHPSGHKELSAGVIAPAVLRPKQVVIPMQQHIGAPCTPRVGVGDYVLRGQKIGDGEGLCLPVHASVSGTVVAVEPRPHVSGRQVMAVVIDNDYQGAEEPAAPAPAPDEDAILRCIREAGIAGMGGAAFPANVKALSAMGKADTLIANACECEPYITADDTLLRTSAEQVLGGLLLLRRVLKPERVILAVEDNKRAAIACLRELLPEYPEIRLKVLPTRYPQGAEKQLILSLTGRQVPPGQLPVSVGCAVYSVSTCAAVYRAVELGLPVTERIVTVTGDGVGQPGNFVVPIGTTFRELLEAAGGLDGDAARVISGGPMMGFAQSDLSVSVLKATNCVLCLSRVPKVPEKPVCIRCGKCVAVCPMGLLPLYLYRFRGDAGKLGRLHNLDCMECGCCAFACPGKLPLVEKIREGKQLVKEAGT